MENKIKIPPRDIINFYQPPVADIVTYFGSNIEKGISEKDIPALLQQYGKNFLKETNRRPAWLIFFEQFQGALVLMLIAAGILASYLGEFRDATILFAIVFFNALVGFSQEFKSEKILKSLRTLVTSQVRVVRDGDEKEINAQDLFPGDIVLLEEGNKISADIRLIESENFATNDFILTGESLPQTKTHTTVIKRTVDLTDRDNCVFMGTTVARGQARGVVFATGMNTEVGQIATSSNDINMAPSPLQKEINHLAKRVTVAAILIALCMMGERYFFEHNSLNAALIFAISIAASMVPEGLPAQISVALSLGLFRLSKKNAVVKKMSAIETLGSATVIASDKTGTITKNEMTITHAYLDGNHFIISGRGYAPGGEVADTHGKKFSKRDMHGAEKFLLAGYFASTGKVHAPDEGHSTWYPIGDPTESAFATLVLKMGWKFEELDKKHPRIETFYFDSNRKRMSVVRDFDADRFVFTKGGIESVLSVCSHQTINGKVVRLTQKDKDHLIGLSQSYAIHALRVLALAYKKIEKTSGYKIDEVESDLIFAGFATMMDPPEDGVRLAIRDTFDAHLRVAIITGDNSLTAQAIANLIGMTNQNSKLPSIVPGDSLARLSDESVWKKLQSRSVIFSRVSPSDKLRIVEILKSHGEVVAVTGDGVNDTLSLKRADIGVAMGLKGSEVAKEAADVILLDDNFSTIVVAIKEGRVIYKNLEKTVLACLTSNFGELFCVLLGFVAAFFGLPAPILAVQILAVDLVGEMLPLAFLATDPPENNLMHQMPRDPKYRIINPRSMSGIVLSGFVMGLMGFLSFFAVYLFSSGTENFYEKATTAAYLGIVFSQFMNILSRRTERSIFTSYFWANKSLIISFFISITLILCLVYVPFLNYFLHTAPLSIYEWGYPVGAALLYLAVYELWKIISRVTKFQTPSSFEVVEKK